MKTSFSLLAIALFLITSCQKPQTDYLTESEERKNERMEWWREARFGMFIHWGLYAVPAGEWNGSTNHAEWIRTTAQIPLETYNGFVDQFNPVMFDANDWVTMAREAGMKYIVITSKHHDGFCLFNSRQTDFDVMSTPFKRDILKELSDACEQQGIKMCWYHSIMDWHHPDYLPRREWETDRSSEGAVFDNYVKYMKGQLKELLTNYGDIGVLWFDGEWESTWNGEYGKDLYNYIRNLQPDIIVNNRVTVGRSGMAGLTAGGEFGGDFGTPEQEIPATGIPGVDWETCMTMNNHWGYNRLDKDFKSSTELLRMLADITSKGGNFLLNIGPTADGTFPPESIERLKEIGIWMKTNGEAIYGTKASPFKSLPWGRCTQKPMVESTRLYLHVFDWPANGQLLVPGIGNAPIRAFVLADPAQELLAVQRVDDALYITLPPLQPDQANSIVVLDIKGTPQIFEAPLISSFSDLFIESATVRIEKPDVLSEIRFTHDGSEPLNTSPLYTTPFTVKTSTTIKAACFLNGKRMTASSVMTMTNVDPRPGRVLEQAKPGLLYLLYDGDWDQVPSFTGLTPKITGVSENFSEASRSTDEKFAIDYQGFINIPETAVYRLHLTSDDGSILYLGEEKVIDHDGLHGASALSAEIALSKGLHALRITFFEKSGGNTLQLEWESENMKRGPVPAENFFHFR